VYDETPWVADTRRTSAVLGWTARTSLEEGIERTIAARP
jgi:nucleoside-diphosphate-sugar epimerase